MPSRHFSRMSLCWLYLCSWEILIARPTLCDNCTNVRLNADIPLTIKLLYKSCDSQHGNQNRLMSREKSLYLLNICIVKWLIFLYMGMSPQLSLLMFAFCSNVSTEKDLRNRTFTFFLNGIPGWVNVDWDLQSSCCFIWDLKFSVLN